MRRYDDPVEVRRDGAARPEQFLWHGRLWKVRAVLAHWVETGPWWQSGRARAVLGTDAGTPGSGVSSGDLLAEREVWRVEAGGGTGSDGVFDLAFGWDDGSWLLLRCAD